jgi:hypothetical protein
MGFIFGGSAKSALLLAALLFVPMPALAQNAVTQDGTVQANKPAMFSGDRRIRQGAGATGGPAGRMITGGFGVTGKVCDFSATTDQPPYNTVCLDAEAGGVTINGVPYLPGPGMGDVVGPASAVDGDLAVFNGTSGKAIKDSGITIRGVPGAVGNGTTDDSQAIRDALAAIPAGGGLLVLNSNKKYRLSSSITLPPNVALDCGQSPGYASSGGQLMSLGGLRVDAAATINMGAGSRLQHCAVFATGINFPIQTPATYAGTAITYPPGNTPDTQLIDTLIVGFNTCVDKSNQADRFHWINLECDGVNGYVVGASADSSEMRNVRAWPWGTATASSPTNTRSGIGFRFTGTSRLDDLKIFGILDFGHATGLDISNTGGQCCNVHFDNVWLDNNATANIVNRANDVSFGKTWLWSSGGPAMELHNVSRTVVSSLFVSGATNAISLIDGAGLTVEYGEFVNLSGKVATIANAGSFIRILSGYIDTDTVTSTPHIAIPAGIVSDRTAINVMMGNGLSSNILGTTSVNPLYSIGDFVGQSTGITAPTMTISGPNQATANLTQAGTLGGSLMLKDTGNAAGNGGSLLFGSNNFHMRHFAAIKGSMVDGGGNTTGDIDFAARSNNGDVALTNTLHVNHTGYLQIKRATIAANLQPCNVGLAGSMQPVSDSNTNVWGATVAAGGPNFVMAFCNGAAWTVMGK